MERDDPADGRAAAAWGDEVNRREAMGLIAPSPLVAVPTAPALHDGELVGGTIRVGNEIHILRRSKPWGWATPDGPRPG